MIRRNTTRTRHRLADLFSRWVRYPISPRIAASRWLSYEHLESRSLMAVGDLRIVTYNVIGYSGTPSADIGKVLKGIGDEVYLGRSRPIDVLAIQEVMSQSTTTAAIVSQLNTIYGAGRYASGLLNGTSTSPNQTVGLIYNTQTVSLLDEKGVGTPSSTGPARQPIRYHLQAIGVPSGNDFYLYNSHYKATSPSTPATDEARRGVEAQMIRQDADALGQGVHIIYAGDHNVKKSSEASIQTLLSAGNGQAFDPLNRVGDWSGNSSFLDVFTQSPITNPPAGSPLVGGGLNDRFDFQWQTSEWTDGIGMEYTTGSYHTFANNGSVPLNGSINASSNTALAGLPNRSTVLDLLTTVTDHLPVVVDYEFRNPTAALTVTLAKGSISENGGTTTATVSRNTIGASPLTVTLSSSDTTAATVTTTITIPAGALNATATVTAVDDSIADGTQTTTITASASGFGNGSAVLNVLDDEVAQLSLTLANNSIPEFNGSTIATVKRNTPTTGSLLVNLSSNDITAATVPVSVTIPAGADSVTFVVSSVDDAIADGNQSALITVSAVGLAPASATVTVVDDEVAKLTLSLANNSISENGGTTVATVRRNTPRSDSLAVDLSSSDVTAATVPKSVVIPAGSDSVTFTVRAVNDSIADGDQISILTATTSGLEPGTIPITVVDDEIATLTLTLNTASIPENGGRVSATVRRNTSTLTAQVVQLSALPSGQVTMPASVTIPAGASLAVFDIASVDNLVATGDVKVDVTASATGMVSGSASLTIIDDEVAQLNLSVANATISENGGSTIATLTRNTPVNVALTVDIGNSDSSIISVPTTVVIPIGSTSVTFAVSAVNNAIATGDLTSTLSATSSGMTDGTASVTVVDDETPQLLFRLDVSSISEKGGVARGTVVRNTPTTQSLLVSISNNQPLALRVPTNVIIPLGATTVEFDATAIDDSVAQGNRDARLGVSANGFARVENTLTLIDDDIPTLTIVLDATSINEAGGIAHATIQRNTPTTTDQRIQLASSDTTAATVVSSVVIPIGASSVIVNIAAVNDFQVDGDQTTIVSASATGFVTASASLKVIDDDVPTLALKLGQTEVAESSGAIVGTVSRNTSTSTELVVTLASSDTTEITVPSSVTIPAGASEATFAVTPIKDGIVDGSQLVSLSASRSGFVQGTAGITVLDVDVWSWTNPTNPLDTNDDGSVDPLDVLALVNELNSKGSRRLTPPTSKPDLFLDPDRDSFLSPLDVLMIINFLNQRGSGEGEDTLTTDTLSPIDPPLKSSWFDAVFAEEWTLHLHEKKNKVR